MCNQVAEVCMPVLTQECLRWEGVHKISLTFITVNNILSGVVRGFLGLVFFFFNSKGNEMWDQFGQRGL